MTSLGFTQGDATWTKLRKRSISDLFWFNTAVLGIHELFPYEQETHLLATRFIERKTGEPMLDEAPIQLTMWPRETGKSTSITEGYAIQRVCAKPNIAVLIANEVGDNAAGFVQTIQKHFETNELLRTLFPEVVPDNFNSVVWSRTEAELVRETRRPEPTFDSVGVGGTKVGSHFDLIICDDLVAEKAMENARVGNWSIMEHANRWVDKLDAMLSKSADPFPQILFIGTHWYPGDTYEYIMDTFGYGQETIPFRITATTSTGKRVSRTATRCGDLAILKIGGYENGKPVFPKIWPEERMEKARMRDPEWFACNVLNDPTISEVRTFQDDWLRYWVFTDRDGKTICYDLPDGKKKFVLTSELYKIIAVDPAASSGSEGARNAIVTLGIDMETGKMLVLDTHAVLSDPKDVVQDVLNIAQRWGCHQVHIELAGQQLYMIQWVERESRIRGYPLAVGHLKPGGRNKDLRIGGLVIPFKNGDLYLHASQSNFIDDEYRKYRPGARRRDLLDALAYAIELAPKPHLHSGQNAQQRSKTAVESFRVRLASRQRKHAETTS